jgi:hypothetical protein
MGLSDFRIRIYANELDTSDVAGPQLRKAGLLAAPDPDNISGLNFGTILPGGFAECSFNFSGASQIECSRWKALFLGQHLEILGSPDEAYVGLIVDVVLDRVNGGVQVSAFGYYVTLSDVPYDTTDTTSETFKNAVYFALSQQGISVDWRGSYLSGVVDDVFETGQTVQRRIGESGTETVRDAIELWSALGDGAGGRVWPAVWVTRNLQVQPESTTTRWRVKVGQLQTATFQTSRSSVINKVVVSFQDVADGVRKFSTPAEDQTSREHYGKLGTTHVAEELSTTAADALAVELLAAWKEPREKHGFVLRGKVLDLGLVERPSWLVRAGDQLEAIDLDLPDRPVGEIVQGRNRWLVRQTSYDADGETLQIVPDEDRDDADVMLDTALRAVATSALRPVTGGGGGGSGTVTSVSAGTGLTATPNPITVSGSIAASFGAIAGKVTEGDKPVLLAGRAGGQNVRGGTGSGEDIILESTGHATKGAAKIQPTSGKTLIGPATNSKNANGVTVNQGGSDDEAGSWQSTDVAHGMTSLADAPTFAAIQKQAAITGGALLRGYSSGTTGAQVDGLHTTDDTTKSTAGVGAINLAGALKSGTSVAGLGASANIVAIRNQATTEWIAGVGGDTWQRGTATMAGLTASQAIATDGSKVLVSVAQTGTGNNVLAAGPALTGVPTAPTAAAGTNTTQIATTAFAAALSDNATYKTLLNVAGSQTAAKVAGTYAIPHGDALAVSGTGTLYPLGVIYIAAADLPTVNGVTTKLRIRAQLYTNDVAPGTGTWTFGLFPITRPGTSGGAGLCIFTLGTVVSGSNGAVFTNPAADLLGNAAGADFALPADGPYVIGVVTTATVAASAHVHVAAQLQFHN